MNALYSHLRRNANQLVSVDVNQWRIAVKYPIGPMGETRKIVYRLTWTGGQLAIGPVWTAKIDRSIYETHTFIITHKHHHRPHVSIGAAC